MRLRIALVSALLLALSLVLVTDVASAITLTRLTYDDRDENWSSLSPDGNTVMYSSGVNICDRGQWFCGPQNIWKLSIDAAGPGEESTEVMPQAYHPRWSPDGKWIAGMVFNGTDYDIHVWPASMDAPGIVFQSTEGADERFPNWSPDSRFIAFDSNRSNPRASEYQIYYAPLASPDDPSVVTRVTFIGTNNKHPTWNNDGTELAYVGDAQNRRSISAIRLSDGAYRKVTPDASQNRHPDWSPDGKWILWTTDRWDGLGDIAITRADGRGAPIRITVGMNGHDDFGEWSLDSKKIVFCGTAIDPPYTPNKEIYIASDLPFAEAAVPVRSGSFGALKAAIAGGH